MAIGLSNLTKFLRAHRVFLGHSNHNCDFSTTFFKSSHIFWLLISITTSVSDKQRLRYCSNSKSHLSGQELNKADIQNVGKAQMLYGGKQAASKVPKDDAKLSCVPAFCPAFTHFAGPWGMFLFSHMFSHIPTTSFLVSFWYTELCKLILWKCGRYPRNVP